MPRKKKKYHFIYKTTNVLSGRYYYGMHSTNNLDDGYLGSGKLLRRSINKHGAENHKREIIQFCDSRKELKSKEEEIVNLNEVAKKNCMNLKVGGSGGFSIKQQQLNAKKSNVRQKELRKNPEWVKKKFENMSKSIKESYDAGKRERIYFYDWNGKQHKEESKRKIGLANSISQRGERNSQFDTCWVTNGLENKKIKKEDIQIHLNQGWFKGRTLP